MSHFFLNSFSFILRKGNITRARPWYSQPKKHLDRMQKIRNLGKYNIRDCSPY